MPGTIVHVSLTTADCGATVRALLAAAPDLTLPDDDMGRTARWAAWLGDCREVTRLLAASRQGR